MKLLKVSFLIIPASGWTVWQGQATTKLSAYRQYVKESKGRLLTVYGSHELELRQYGTVRKLSRGYWVDCYQ